MKILTVIGARPQFIKAAAISRVISSTNGVEEILLHTGQHYDTNMSDVFFSELGIPSPDYNLGIGGGGHGAQTGRMLEAIENVLIKEKPNWVLVYGDTNSTLAGALAAAKLNIPVAHVEAGLRSYNRNMPEEINRVMTDHISNILFAPTNEAVKVLKKEGIEDNSIVKTGDIMYDTALYCKVASEQHRTILSDIGIVAKRYILVTIHRAENTDNPSRLRAIFESLEKVGLNTTVILPLHPRTKKALDESGYQTEKSAITFLNPVGYLDMVALEVSASLIVTDSGGVQKEAYFHSVPCVTIRDETEWVELLACGCNTLASPENLVHKVEQMLIRTCDFNDLLYGDGKSAQMIVNALKY